MRYDFDKVIDRVPFNSVKWSIIKQATGDEDVIPMWIADMDFASPPEVTEALKERVAHPLYGYTLASDGYFNGLINWMKKRQLGPAGAIRFLQQYESGQGDYTRNRKKLLPKKSVREIGKQIMKQRQYKAK